MTAAQDYAKTEVWLTVTGEQTLAEGSKDSSRTSVRALYENRDGVRVFRFREEDSQSGAVTESVMEFSEGICSITRSGGINVVMKFAPGQEQNCMYGTPFGAIPMAVLTRHFAVKEIGGNFHARIRYRLVPEGGDPMECAVTVKAEPVE